MDARLSKYIEEYGGKHGGLLFFREHVKDGQKYVPPMEVANLQDLSQQRIAAEIARGIRTACRELGTDQFIARTSIAGDWTGLTDAMPTIPHIPIHVLGDNYPTSIAKTLMDGCTNPDLHEFARREGFDFDPAKVTVAFMPQLPFPCSTITEHPNQPGVDLVDIYAPFDGPTLRESNYMTWKESINYLDGKPDMKVRRFPKEMPPSLTMPSWVREAGVLDHNTTAYQWEGACRGEHPHWLLQIREFAQKRSADFRFPTPDFLEHTRFFGVTPKEGITLIYVSVRHRSHFKFFEQPSPDIPYFLEVEWNNNTSPLQLEEQPNHMHGFQLRMLRSLSHQATRYTQIALRNPHGLVAVGGTDDRFGAFKTGDKVRITADGYVWKVTAV